MASPISDSAGELLAVAFTSYWMRKHGRLPSGEGSDEQLTAAQAEYQELKKEWFDWTVLCGMLLMGDFDPDDASPEDASA